MAEHKESYEDYLERILMIENAQGHVRAIDIANGLKFTKASVSIALKKLVQDHLVLINEDNSIHLTSDGLKIAKATLERHEVLTKGLILLGVNEKTALEDACKIEHDLSEETFTKIKEHINKHK